MILRTFGWIQNSAKTSSLKSLIKVFILDSDVNKMLRETKLASLIADKAKRDYFIQLISADRIIIPYKMLKGRGFHKKRRALFRYRAGGNSSSGR